MPILVISDIHANLTALETILHDAGEYEAAWCLGDLVGYGPDPNECIQVVQNLPGLICIIGNHDAAALEFPPAAFPPWKDRRFWHPDGPQVRNPPQAASPGLSFQPVAAAGGSHRRGTHFRQRSCFRSV